MDIRLLTTAAAALAATTFAFGGGSIQINEIRIDQPGGDDDEYFELSGPPGASLDGLTYLVIGDGTGGSGVIESVLDLTGLTLDGAGRLVVAEGTFTLGTADFTAALNFENSDNVTHRLVDGFTGANGDDLDTDDDGVLDVTPWSAVVDTIALIEEENPPSGTEYAYGPTIGPDGGFTPGHVYRCTPDGDWTIGAFDPVGGDDTPGAENPACPIPLFVENVDTGEMFASIQDAIDDADTLNGHVIQISGDLTTGPQVVVNKSLTLSGVSSGPGGLPIITPSADTGSSGDARGWFLVPSGNAVAVENLAFDGSGFLIHQAFRHIGSGSFADCSFSNIQFNASGPTYAGSAIVAFGDGPVHVTDVTMNQIGRQGLFYFGPGVNGSICERLEYTGKGDGDFLDYGVEVGGGAQAEIVDATITDCRGVASSDGSTSAGMLVTTFFGAGSAADISGCTLTGNSTGIFVGFDASDTSTVVANFNNIAGNDFGLRSTAPEVEAKGNWWGDAGGPNDPVGTVAAMNGLCPPVAMSFNDNVAGDEVEDELVCYCPWAESMISGLSGDLVLQADGPCLSDTQIEVELAMLDLTGPVTGFQAFLAFDDAILAFRGDLSSYTGSPFPLHIQPIGGAEVAPGELRLDGSVALGGPGVVQDAVLATLVFDVISPCAATEVAFDLTQLFDSELSFEGAPVPTDLIDTGSLILDSTPPVLDPCPANIVAASDAGAGDGCQGAIVEFADPAAIDACDGSVVTVCTPPSGTFFPVGVTTVTCTATDSCGNTSMCMFDVEVTPTNLIDVDVVLDAVFAPTTRCIRFVTDDCGTFVDVPLDFIDDDANGATPVRAIDTIEVPCGVWTSLCAKDEQHTLWDTTGLVLSGDLTRYETDAAHVLRSGDTDNDSDVDINDVTWLVLTFGDLASPGGCPYDGVTRDADYDQDGVVGSNDYTILSANWLQLTICGCGGASPADQRVRTARLVRELGAGAAESLDRNADGWFDWRDVERFEREHGLSGELSRAMARTVSSR